VDFRHIPKFKILVCDKPNSLKMNLVLKFQTNQKRNLEILLSILFSLLHDLARTNEPRYNLASILETS
jgi:hypothetical protein